MFTLIQFPPQLLCSQVENLYKMDKQTDKQVRYVISRIGMDTQKQVGWRDFHKEQSMI